MRLRPGQELAIRLASIAGCSWEMFQLPNFVIQLSQHPMGAPGVKVFRFNALTPGKGRLELRCQRRPEETTERSFSLFLSSWMCNKAKETRREAPVSAQAASRSSLVR